MLNLIEAIVALAVLGILFGWTALAMGAAFPSRALAIGVPAGIGAVGYLVGGLHSLAPWLDPFRFGAGGVVAAVAICVLLVGAWRAERRDLQTP